MITVGDVRYFTPLEAHDRLRKHYKSTMKQSSFYWNIEKNILRTTDIDTRMYITENDLRDFAEYVKLPRHKRRVILYENAKVLAFANHKGGVGKTVSVHNVSAAMAARRHKVLMIDFDPQANLSFSAGVDVLEANTIDDIFLGKCSTNDAIYEISTYLHIIPAYKTLSLFERKPNEYKLNYSMLTSIIEKLRPFYDLIIFDAPPHLSLLTTSVLIATDLVFIPFQPDSFSYEGLETFIEYAKEEKPDIQIAGIFLTRFQANRALDNAIVEEVQDKYSKIFLKTSIRENISIKEANTQKVDIFTYRPNSHGAADYIKLTKNIMAVLPKE